MKELLVPYREQKAKMREGGVYLVYVYLDHTTQRIVASAKIEKFIGNIVPRYRVGAHVKALVFQQAEGLGYRVIVDNLHYGMIYESELCAPLEISPWQVLRVPGRQGLQISCWQYSRHRPKVRLQFVTSPLPKRYTKCSSAARKTSKRHWATCTVNVWWR